MKLVVTEYKEKEHVLELRLVQSDGGYVTLESRKNGGLWLTEAQILCSGNCYTNFKGVLNWIAAIP